MNLNLSDLLTPAEVEFFSTQREEAQLRLNSAEAEQVAAIRAHFADERLQLTRRVLLSVLSVSAPLPSQPSVIMVTPTAALEVPVQEDDSLCPSCGTPREWCPTDWENGRVTNPGYYYDCENPTCPLLEDVNTPASGEDPPVLNILTDVKMLSTPTPTPPSGNILRCAGPTSETWAVRCPKKALVSAVGKRCLSCSAKERMTRVGMPSCKGGIVTPKKVSVPPAPAFDINEEGRFEAVEHGRIFLRDEKQFNLWRIYQPSVYQWRAGGIAQTTGIGLEGGEIVERWQLNGLGQWESTPEVPGHVGTRNGVTTGPIVGKLA